MDSGMLTIPIIFLDLLFEYLAFGGLRECLVC